MNNAVADEGLVSNLGVERNLRARIDKPELIDDLLRALDTLIFLQLAILYHFDNLTFLLAIRAVSQILYVQARPAPFTNASQLPPVIFANFACILTHILRQRPESTGRAARGYLHGGLIVDFVGELGPISKWRLLLLDVLILGLQLFMLVVGSEKHGLNGESAQESSTAVQDIDAEEAGIRRSQDNETTRANENEEGIELQNLLSSIDQGPRKPQQESTGNNDEDMILQINVAKSLRNLMKKSPSTDTATALTSSQNATNMTNLLRRIAVARTRAADGG